MRRSTYLAFSVVVLLVACAARADSSVQEEDPGMWRSPAFEDQVGPGRYREVALHGADGKARVLTALEGYFEYAGPMQISSGGIVRLHEIAMGLVVAEAEASLHDRYYCTFASVRTACVYARETGAICDGSWRSDGLWATTSEQLVDIETLRVTAEEIASGAQELGGHIGNSYENLLRCDPPGNRNNVYYDEINRRRSPNG